MSAKKVTNIISGVSVCLVVLLALAAFRLSYNALAEVATDNGIPNNLAPIWPLIVDGAIVVFSFSLVRAYLLQENTTWIWAILLSFTALTILFNVLHSGWGFVPVMVAIVPPIALVLAFETLMSNLRAHVGRSGLLQSIADLTQEYQQKRAELDKITTGRQEAIDNLTEQRDKAKGQLVNLEQTIQAKRDEIKQTGEGQHRVYIPADMTIEQRQSLVQQMDNDGVTQKLMKDMLGVSYSTIKNDKAAIEQAKILDHADTIPTTGGTNGHKK